MMWWIAIAAYVAIGAYLTPRFARDSYLQQKARWTYTPKEANLSNGALLGWMKSWVWPVWLIVSVAVEHITADERAEVEQRERAKTVDGARAVIARYEAEEQRKWDAEFRNGGSK